MPVKHTAHFTPEAWIHNQAVEVDPEGPQEWDCTTFAEQHAEYLARLTGDYSDPLGVVDNDDVFKGDPAAPQWVRDWAGPFTIRVRAVKPVLSLPEGTHLAYVVAHEAWYWDASRTLGDRPHLSISATTDPYRSVVWEFQISEHDRHASGIRIEMWDEAFQALAQVPELFAALAELGDGATLADVRCALNRLGAKDETRRVSPYAHTDRN